MAIPFKKYGYTLNPITDEIETPQVFLVNKRLKKIGELYPVENLRITVNEVNQPDEVSFTYYKEINGGKSPYFNEIDDLSVIQVGGFGFFECSISKNQNTSVLKSVTAKSLGYAELSQTLHTLEVNTEDDMSRTDYDKDYPTIFYREIPTDADEENAKKLRESSLLHRILTETPHYKIGYVDPTLWYVQRTFSWSDKDIVSILNEVAEEITCIFDIQVRIGDNGEIERIVNAYDMQYCSHCWEKVKEYGETVTSSTSKFRNIVNGVCQNCGESKYVKDIGEDSGIYISTDNLSDDISINGDPDSIKNCLKITGGDDIMTATVQGLNMSASSKIMAFSDLQKKAMSPELRKKLDDYNTDYSDNIEDYEALLETEYNMQDIRLYLQSGKMPQIEKEIKTTDEALYSVLSNIEKYFKAKFFISSYENYYKYPTSSARTSISNMFTTFMPEGFSMTIDKSSSEEDTPGKVFDPNAIYGWYGTVKVYSTGNRDDSYTLHITKSNGTYVTSGTSEEHYISSDASIQSMVDNFRIQFYFADQTQEEYKEYLEQYTAYLLSTVDLSYENEQKKEWDKYGYNLLKSYADGYQKCIETIDDMLSTAGETQEILNETREKYVSIQHDILLQMNVLEDQIFAVCRYLGGSYNDSYLNDNGEISYNYKYYKDDKKATIQEIFDHMINPDYAGGYNDDQTVYTPNEYIGDKPFQCLKCHSSNVAVSTGGNICRNDGCGAKGSDIYTYCDMMQNIADSYREHSASGKTIVELRTDYRNRFDIKNYLGDTLYIELRSFIREDVYNNSNFTSDGLSNSQIIEQAKELKAKAEQELAKACNPQYSVTTSLSSVVAQKEFVYQGVTVNDDYSKFMINNYVRVLIDEELYKMRLTSITFQFPVTDKIEVTFSNVTNCKTNTAMNVKEILDSAASMATSYEYVATQADKGAVANDQFIDIMNEGLNASLMAVKNSRDQDVVIDSHGIFLRKKIHETDEYSPYQMKLINRNIVMTDDNWETAKLAIGLGLYEGVERYGVWADVICGNLLCGNKLAIYGGGDGTAENATVIIDGKGITLDGGKITWTKKLPTSSVDGLDDTVYNFVEAIGDLQSQIDGEITSWFEEYEPTTANEPASTWITDADKIKHEGDLFYNTATGAAYRYIYNSSAKEHQWSIITDTAITEALEKASMAQDTADKKRRVFVVQPTPPYDVGDLWSQGENGDLMKCKTAKVEGQSYSAYDWEKASKYTDDSAWKTWTSDSGEFGKYKEDIKKQIDGKSNCTYGGSAPPSNPETGDLWFCTDGSDSYGANKAYMYNGSTWKESNGVPDSVWDIADGKSSIFVVKPNKALSSIDPHFYYANDIWILESDMTLNSKSYKAGSILTSTSDSTSFVESHWVEKVRYTDDTNALIALKKAEQGISDAADALTSAKNYAVSQDSTLSSNITKAYQDAINDFDKAVAEYLQVPGATTIVGGNHVISPYITGGYLYITGDNGSVEINPKLITGYEGRSGDIFNIRNSSNTSVFHVNTSGQVAISGGNSSSSIKLDGKNGSIFTTNGASKTLLASGYLSSTDGTYTSYLNNAALEFKKDSTYYARFSSTYWVGTEIRGVGVNSYADSKFISFGNKTDNSQSSFITPLVLNYGLNPNGDTQDILIYGTTKMTGNLYFNNGSYVGAWTGGGAYFSSYAYFNSSIFLPCNHYLMSNAVATGTNTYLSTIGRSSTGNIWIGHYDATYTDQTNTIQLNASKIYSKGTHYTSSGSVVTSDKRLKTDIEELDETSVDFILGLIPSKYKLKDGTSGRYHFGFIAQPVKELMDNTVGDVGLLVKNEIGTTDDDGYVPVDLDDENTYMYGLRYEEFIAPMIKTIQLQQKEIERLRKEVNSLKEII